MPWVILAIGIVILSGLFNPWTGLFGDTFYSPKASKRYNDPESKIKHKSFRLTK